LAGGGGVDPADGVGGGFGCLQVPASSSTLAAEMHPAGVRSVSGSSGWRGVEARGGERASVRQQTPSYLLSPCA
jgi:hypothetical protein